MEKGPEQASKTEQFPEKIGDDYELWKKYHEVHGPEAYRWRRVAEELCRHNSEITKIAEEQGVKFPDEMNLT